LNLLFIVSHISERQCN